ncbi:hypothetical protein FBZ96_102646 [Bradyrhizobium stylosanthis]|uniref:Uncharacterized protein n=1 Tax=Bradyrhizobium stylosanthis TaxID=1803665 RepID=A0A560E459_9BRAD|nr:hypothetical protein FBZ96_102646 [Bradyrhizobium stylosanthis]
MQNVHPTRRWSFNWRCLGASAADHLRDDPLIYRQPAAPTPAREIKRNNPDAASIKLRAELKARLACRIWRHRGSSIRSRLTTRCRLRTSLRAQRSNPDCLRGKTLDCFAALAMTMWRAIYPKPSRCARPMPGDPSGKTPSIPTRKNIPLSRISDLWHTPLIPVLPKGRSRPSRDAGRVAMDAAAPARNVWDRAGNRESCATRYDTARSKRLGWSSWASTRQPLMIRQNRPRTEKSCGPDARGLCVKACGDAAANRRAHRSSARRRGQ